MIEEVTAQKTAAYLARRIVAARVKTEDGYTEATRLTVQSNAAHITALVVIGSDILGKSDVTELKLYDSGGDCCYTRALELQKRTGEGAVCRVDITVSVEEEQTHV